MKKVLVINGENYWQDYLVVPYELCLPNNILFLA
jgi:hypothetical protein